MTAARYLLHCCLSDAPAQPLWLPAADRGMQPWMTQVGTPLLLEEGRTWPVENRRTITCSFLHEIDDFHLKIGCIAYAILKSFKEGRSSNQRHCS